MATQANSPLDTDGDGIGDDDEMRLGTNRFSRDSDLDGFPDGLEVALGSGPLDFDSRPNVNPPGFALGWDVSIFNSGLLARRTAPAPGLPLRRR